MKNNRFQLIFEAFFGPLSYCVGSIKFLNSFFRRSCREIGHKRTHIAKLSLWRPGVSIHFGMMKKVKLPIFPLSLFLLEIWPPSFSLFPLSCVQNPFFKLSTKFRDSPKKNWRRRVFQQQRQQRRRQQQEELARRYSYLDTRSPLTYKSKKGKKTCTGGIAEPAG